MRKDIHILYPFFSLLIGLFLTQVLATIQVYLSNTHLYDSLLAIKDAGFLPVPNRHIMGQLHNFGPAFCAGLFFTFSIGAGISFFSLGLAWIWNRLFSRNQYLLYLFMFLWLLCLLLLNFHGFNLFATLYFFVIPSAVFTFALKSLTHLNRQKRRRNEIIHIIPVMVLALLLSWQLDKRMFTDFRDIFLLSNPVGSRINNFYYKYTLYAAEVIKSLDQKMLKTYRAEKAKKSNAMFFLEKILADYDYIPIEKRTDVDLKIAFADNNFTFENLGEPIFQISSKALLAEPGKALKEFSNKTDTFVFFRKIIFWSLLVGLPLAIYVLGHGLTSIALNLFLDMETSCVIASAFIFILSLTLIFSFQFNRSRDVSARNLKDALSSDRWQDRVAALKIIDEKGLEIKRFDAYPKLLKSPHIPERYWTVRALANSRSPETYRDLLRFLEDPHRNVLTMAFYALGKRGNRQAITDIINKIDASDDWYSQWYAYKALRSLGWKQTELE
jgi:hypothetical protein